jgi:hypothetical protein
MELREAILQACQVSGITLSDLKSALEQIERLVNGEPTFNQLLNACDDLARKVG